MTVKALLFDTFGTVVDWRGSIVAEGETWGPRIDWGAFADRWRAGYAPAMDRVRRGEIPWTNLDRLHRARLEELLRSFTSRVYLRRRKTTGIACGIASNRGPIPFPVSLASSRNTPLRPSPTETSPCSPTWPSTPAFRGTSFSLPNSPRHYKPDGEAYLTAVELLGLTPAEVMMCAAHIGDLSSARDAGLRTGFIHRPPRVRSDADGRRRETGGFRRRGVWDDGPGVATRRLTDLFRLESDVHQAAIAFHLQYDRVGILQLVELFAQSGHVCHRGVVDGVDYVAQSEAVTRVSGVAAACPLPPRRNAFASRAAALTPSRPHRSPEFLTD